VIPWTEIAIAAAILIGFVVLILVIRWQAKQEGELEQARKETERTDEVSKTVDDARQHPITGDELFGDRTKPPTS